MSIAVINPDNLSTHNLRREFLAGPYLDLVTKRVNDQLNTTKPKANPFEGRLTYKVGSVFRSELETILRRIYINK